MLVIDAEAVVVLAVQIYQLQYAERREVIFPVICCKLKTFHVQT